MGQLDKSGHEYILHPLTVMLLAFNNGLNDDVLMTSVLHDVIEDTEYTLSDLVDMGYPDPVIKALNLLSRRSEETYNHYIMRVLEDHMAIVVKYLDASHNRNRSEGVSPDFKRFLEKRYGGTIDKIEAEYGLKFEEGKLNVATIFPELMRGRV
jgi:(p)ppGpp synthase/HD superfamily hydrolase